MDYLESLKKDGKVVPFDPKAIKTLTQNAQARTMESVERIRLPQIKTTSGGIPGFVFPNGDVVKEFRAVICDIWRSNAWWQRGMDEGSVNEAPDCCSLNGKIPNKQFSPLMQSTRCFDCPRNVFTKGAGKGKECKNMKRLLLLVPGSELPMVYSAPPTSIPKIDEYLLSLAGLGIKDYSYLFTKFATTIETSKGGHKFSQAVLVVEGMLAEPEDLLMVHEKLMTDIEPFRSIAREEGVQASEDYPMKAHQGEVSPEGVSPGVSPTETIDVEPVVNESMDLDDIPF